MLLSKANAKENYVKITSDFGESEAFKRYLAISKDAFVLGVGRLVAVSLQVLAVSRTHFTRFELDRATQWPADRKYGFGETLEMVGWARPYNGGKTYLELLLPEGLAPRRPHREKGGFQSMKPRDAQNRFVSAASLASEILTYKKKKVLLIDIDGELVYDLDSVTKPQKPSNLVRRRKKADSET